MKKKLWLIILAAAVLAVLFVPIPKSPYRDGGTREYSALTYKLIHWSRLTDDGVYESSRLYWLPQNFRSIDDLWAGEEQNVVHKFVATVVQINGTSVLVQPVEGEEELRSSDCFSISTAQLGNIGAQVGSNVEIFYRGGIMESYPAQINAVKWEMAADRQQGEPIEIWLDKETAEKCSDDLFDHILITEISSDCFFAKTVVLSPYTIKLNGQLGEDWCVGDQVICTYENTYYDPKTQRIEADMLSIAPSDWQQELEAARKPVIYLYPETQMQVSVELLLDGRLTCTYPAYNGGWQVTAAPDGTLTDQNGQTYSYLYWEGETYSQWDMSKGFCVRGEDTAAFLEESLEKLGLTRREANEFIVYWLPLMEGNPYNIISFQTDAYTDAAQLQVSPAPDTVIRVFMAWQSSEVFADIPAQELTAPERTGFTVIEWGGAEVG